MTRKSILTLIAILAACSMVSAQKYKYIDKTVAVVGNEAIMISDIESSVKERGAQGLSSDRNVRCEVLENMLESKLFLMQARIDSLSVNQDNVEGMLSQRIDQFLTYLGGEDKLEEYFGKPLYRLRQDWRKQYEDIWNAYKAEGKRVVKFVPASGAASRMFKNMFAFVDADYDVPTTDFEKKYFDSIEKFAFYDALDAACQKNEGKGIKALIADGNYKAVAANMLKAEGLNYGQLPKGLLLFHKYPEGPRTPMEEHLVEGALYAASNGEAHVHFTVSHEHMELFKAKVAEKADMFAKKYGIKYDITFSEQKPSTDTVAANPDNTPFRNDDGSLLFRPGGHGALIENLNEIEADVMANLVVARSSLTIRTALSACRRRPADICVCSTPEQRMPSWRRLPSSSASVSAPMPRARRPMLPICVRS